MNDDRRECDRESEWLSTVRSGYDELADAYDEQRESDDDVPFVRSLSNAIEPGSRVVDAGCGGGRGGLETLAERHDVVGVDLSRAQLDLARERVPGAALVQGELTRLPLADDAAAGLCSLHAIIHVPRERHDAVFAEFARVLEPGGELLVTTGVGDWEGRNDAWLADDAAGDDGGDEPDDIRDDSGDAGGGAPMRWSFHGREKSRDLLESAGFEVRESAVVGDELGGGEWLFVRARLTA